VCRVERRRADTRASHWNGIDFVEVDDDQLKLCVRFLGHAPEGLVPANVAISGGERITGIRVVDVDIRRSADPELDDCLEVAVDRPGDFSTYTLELVDLDEEGRPTDRPLTGFDPRYSSIDFSFKAGCPSDLDCAPVDECPAPELEEPALSYLAKDYPTLRQLILDRLAQVMPEWRERHVPDLYLALVEILAYEGDRLSYYQDAVATEAYLNTARRRVSVRRHARLVDYLVHEGCNARAWVTVETDTDVPELDPRELSFLTGRAGEPGEVLSATALDGLVRDGALVFEPLVLSRGEHLRLRKAHNAIRLYTWGDRECCLPAGTTRAVLRDTDADDAELRRVPLEYEDELAEPVRALELRPGDILLFEEVKGPRTGEPEDADPARRHAVRLVRVTPVVDPLYSLPVPDSEQRHSEQPYSEQRHSEQRYTEQRMPLPLLEVEWGEEDALPFPLCVSSLGRPPECEVVDDVSIARGNVILADHGRSVDEDLGTVEAEPPDPRCEEEGRQEELVPRSKRFGPRLGLAPLTFAEPVAAGVPAASLLAQDPRLALPQLRLTGKRYPPSPRDDSSWEPRRDLLASGPRDQHFVVEVDEEGRGQLRFGDGELGWRPPPGTSFKARYRVGNGTPGNVGAGVLTTIVDRAGALAGLRLVPTNPLPAQGGTDPEPAAQVKQLAPYAFRAQRVRAVVPDDYAELAQRTRGVQRAAAELRWTGSWYRMNVGIDPVGAVDAPEELLEAVRRDLYPCRRIGHDLEVVRAGVVALDLELEVCVEPEHVRGDVEADVLEVLGTRRLPDGRLGLFHPDNLTFGQGVYVSTIVAAVQAVPGVRSVDVTKLERLFEGPRGEVEAGVLPLRPTEVARLDNDRSFPEHGRLRLVMRGGR
jgi:hypothetical protein